MAEKDRNEQSVKSQTGAERESAPTQSGTQSGEPGRTPDKAEGSRENVESSLRNQENKQQR